ncbi:PQ-loop repeat-containing protein [Sorangium sp. So ce726]|uniref:hypothetical protein n=1 Tax=Sorangium sp. So ce726 TaxID=3133319 RepID=UPI003F5D6077
MKDAIGWVSSGILVLTIGNQVYKQWRSKTSQGISSWLFLGQLAASIGFVIYSWMLESWVFVATNSLMVANALAGATIVFLQRRRRAPRSAEDEARARRAFKFPRAAGPQGRHLKAGRRSLACGVLSRTSGIRSKRTHIHATRALLSAQTRGKPANRA